MKAKVKMVVRAQASPSVAPVDDAVDRFFNEISPLIAAARERVAISDRVDLLFKRYAE